MGETAPPQTPTGSLGIGVSGVGLLGGGSVTPRVHNAIVERLRARIAVCRQHHLNCEGRYERSRAESSDRERENTLQLLTLVQNGQGTRKGTKHNKNTCPPPPDYQQHQKQQHLLNKDGNGNEISDQQHQTTSNGLDPRNSALIALQGSLKRKLVVNVPPGHNKMSNGISEHSFLDFKKLRANERISLGQNIFHTIDGLPQTGPAAMSVDQGLHPKNNNPINNNSNCDANDLFNLTLKDIKKEPGENMSCSNHLDGPQSYENMVKYVDDFGEQLMDPDLQELFNELTYISVPPMTDSELQNMINITIKQDDSFNIDICQQNQRNMSTSLSMDKIVIKSEYPQSIHSTRVGSPLMRPSSTGPPYSMSNGLSTNTTISQSQTQVSSGVNRTLSSWQELSHAQQLKQIAANRQHHSLRLQQQTDQSSSWPNMSPTRPLTGPFGHEKVPSPFRQQQLSPHSTTGPVNGSQPKVTSNYLYKPNAGSQNNHLEVTTQPKPNDPCKNSVNTNHSNLDNHPSSTKSLFHFNSNNANQQVSSKPLLQYTQQQQQASATVQQQHEPAQQSKSLSSQPLQRQAAFQQKIIGQKMQQISGLHYPAVHQQQEQHSTANQVTSNNTNRSSCTSPSTGSSYGSQQSLLNQQLMEKTNIMQRQIIEHKQQLALQQQMLAATEKSNTQDQLSRHLTRPPPDYKDQRRSTVSLQQSSQYSSGLPTVGVSSNPPISNSVSPHNSVNSPSNLASRMASLQGAQNVYGNIPCPQQAMYNVNPDVNQMQQTSPNQNGAAQNNNILPCQSNVAHGKNRPTFSTGSGMNPPPFRPNASQGLNMSGQRPSNIVMNSPSPQNWVPPDAKKHDTICFPNNNQFSNASFQGMLSNQHFSQRAPSSQLSQGEQIKTVSQMSQSTSGKTMESIRSFNIGQTQMRPPVLPNQAGGSMTPNTFTSSNQVSPTFSGTDTNNDLGSFDFLSQNNGLGSALSGDSDFIDALLKTGNNNDDWMKDINLDEIFRNHS